MHSHPYLLQVGAFAGSLLLPATLFALLGGAWLEQVRRGRPVLPARKKKKVSLGVSWGTEYPSK
jgi:hypothetical protein